MLGVHEPESVLDETLIGVALTDVRAESMPAVAAMLAGLVARRAEHGNPLAARVPDVDAKHVKGVCGFVGDVTGGCNGDGAAQRSRAGGSGGRIDDRDIAG